MFNDNQLLMVYEIGKSISFKVSTKTVLQITGTAKSLNASNEMQTRPLNLLCYMAIWFNLFQY